MVTIHTCEVSINTVAYGWVLCIVAPATPEVLEAGLAGVEGCAVVTHALRVLAVHPARALAQQVARHVVGERQAGGRVLAPRALVLAGDTRRTGAASTQANNTRWLNGKLMNNIR